eukprot:495676-Prorocentrum_minimum.AAC.1
MRAELAGACRRGGRFCKAGDDITVEHLSGSVVLPGALQQQRHCAVDAPGPGGDHGGRPVPRLHVVL